MNKKQISVSIIMGVLLLVAIISISFAWYQATINNNSIPNLDSEGITLELNNEPDNTLTPDCLLEGVLNNNKSLPSDYSSNKNSYVSSEGNKIYYQEQVKLIYKNFSTVNLSAFITYNGLDQAVAATSYLDIHIYISSTEISLDDLSGATSLGLIDNNTDFEIESTFGSVINPNNTFYMVFVVSFNQPDELLPSDLIESDMIKLNIIATLQ